MDVLGKARSEEGRVGLAEYSYKDVEVSPELGQSYTFLKLTKGRPFGPGF